MRLWNPGTRRKIVQFRNRLAMSNGRPTQSRKPLKSSVFVAPLPTGRGCYQRFEFRRCTLDTNPLFHRLLNRFKALTGCPVLVNTSFNVRGEPIVCTPEDAFRCFMGNDLDVLVVGNCIMHKAEQDPSLRLDYKNSFDLD